MKITKEEKLTEITYYGCDSCDYKNEYQSNTLQHVASHIQKNYIGNSLAFFVENETQLQFLKEQYGGKWTKQLLPNWFVCYEEHDRDCWVPIADYVSRLDDDIQELEEKIYNIKKYKEEFIKFAEKECSQKS